MSKAIRCEVCGETPGSDFRAEKLREELLRGIESQALTIKEVLKNGTTARECATRILAAVGHLRSGSRP